MKRVGEAEVDDGGDDNDDEQPMELTNYKSNDYSQNNNSSRNRSNRSSYDGGPLIIATDVVTNGEPAAAPAAPVETGVPATAAGN